MLRERTFLLLVAVLVVVVVVVVAMIDAAARRFLYQARRLINLHENVGARAIVVFFFDTPRNVD